MPLSKPCPGIERKVIALACVAITDRPIVPQPVDWLPLRYVLRLRMWRVRHEPYAAMPTMVPSNTTQSATFTRRSERTSPAGPPRGQTTRTRTGTRRATCGTQAGRGARHRIAGQAAAVGSLAQGDEIREQPIRSGHSFRKLPKPRQAGVHEIPLSVPCHEQAASERCLAGIAGREDRREALVPLVREIQAALLDPPVKICFGDAIRPGQRRMIWRQKRHRRMCVRDSVSREAQVKGRQPVCAEAVGAVVLCDDISACLDIREQRRYMASEIHPGVEGPDTDD